ncbi:MAG TPA: methyltransferase domain-containing protein [Alloacidobacterium sp.]|nr:methyltransferase domain-containing protein [Alloacidobacterium sp.]
MTYPLLFKPIDFTSRAQLEELMDGPCTYEEYRACILDLESVNRLLDGYQPILHWLSSLAGSHNKPLHIVDVGSGGGGMLRKLESSAICNEHQLKLVGIDQNPYAARISREISSPGSKISWVTCNVFSYASAEPIDVITSSLFTHHLSEDEIVQFLIWMEANARLGWFINDLHRSAVSFHTFRLLAWAMRWHRFVRHDGPVSIRRSFRSEDWLRMCEAANLPLQKIEIRKNAFGRLCVSRIKS